MRNNILSIIICCLVQFSYAQAPINYVIKRTDYVKSTYKTFTYELKNDSIIVMRYSTNNRPTKLLYSNVLNTEQKYKLTNVLKDFDLAKMQSKYIDENIDGEGHSVYDLTINQEFKNIYVYFGSEPNLKKLDAFIYEILPKDQNNWYEVYWNSWLKNYWQQCIYKIDVIVVKLAIVARFKIVTDWISLSPSIAYISRAYRYPQP